MKRKTMFNRAVVLWPAMCLVATPTLAEVCDKVAGDAWRPIDGPVGMLNFAAPSWLGYVAIAFSIIVLATAQRPWAAYVAAGFPAIAALLWTLDLTRDDEVSRAAVQEGCRSAAASIMDISIMLTAAIVFWLIGRSFRSVEAAP